jgi:hypothetical protein
MNVSKKEHAFEIEIGLRNFGSPGSHVGLKNESISRGFQPDSGKPVPVSIFFDPDRGYFAGLLLIFFAFAVDFI